MKAREVTNRYRLAQWAEIVQERTSSGERVEEFCQRKGISKFQYYYWLRKLRTVVGVQLVEQQPKETGLAVQGFAEVKLSTPPSSSGASEIDQICIETGLCKITAGRGYPTGALLEVLREIVKPC